MLHHTKTALEQQGGQASEPFVSRSAECGSSGPQGPCMAVFGTDAFEPFPVMAHEVAETPGVRVERIPKECEIRAGKSVDTSIRTMLFVMENGIDESPCVVVGAIRFMIVRDVIYGVLKDPRVIRHPV